MINIAQITNFDLASASTIQKTIHRGGEGTTVTADYKEITQSMLGGKPIFKMGYCTEVKGIDLPIFLTVNGEEEKEFQVGKTGMYEFQPEVWGAEEHPLEVEVTNIAVPANIVFTLDYCYYTD